MTSDLSILEDFARTHLQPLGVRILFALCVFLTGRWVARFLAAGLERGMDRANVDPSLRKFLRDLAYAGMIVAVAIIALDAVGIETTSLVAVLGAAGLAIGLALQGSLSNFAAGVMLIVLRPYKVTDLVKLGAHVGRVEAIRIFHTVIVTFDNREVSLPNGKVLAGEIENLTALGRRRVDLVVTFPSLPDIERAKTLASAAVLNTQDVLESPRPEIAVARVTQSMVELTVRPWTKNETFDGIVSELMASLRSKLGSEGLEFTVVYQPSA